MAVSSLKIQSSSYSETEKTYSFDLTFFNPDNFDSGYEVYARVPDSSVVLLGRFVNFSVLTVPIENENEVVVNPGGDLQISLTFSDSLIPFGAELKLFLRVYRKDGSYTYDSETVRFRSPISKITDFSVHYNTDEIIFKWEPKLDESVSTYVLERAQGQQVQDFDIDYQSVDGVLFNSTSFKVGEQYYVHDTLNDFFWYPVTCTTGGFIQITNTQLVNEIVFVNYQAVTTLNYHIYSFPTEMQQITAIDGNFFNSSISIPGIGDDFIYRFRVHGTGGDLNIYSDFQYKRLVSIRNKIPRLYPAYESTDFDYGNEFFYTMRNMLVDSNVYKKDQLSLPYKMGDDNSYNFRGFAGVEDCPVELYIDDVIYGTYRTDANGEFAIDFTTDKVSATLSIVVYNYLRTETFVPIYEINFDKVLVYNYLAVMATMLRDIDANGFTLNMQRKVLPLADETVIREFYGRLLGLNFGFDDVYEKFREEVVFLYPFLWNNPNGGRSGVYESVLSYYRDKDYGISGFEIFRNGDPVKNGNDLLKLGSTTITSLKTQIGSNKYTYYVTAIDPTIPTKESVPVTITLDNRLYGVDKTKNFPPNVLVWDPLERRGDIKYNVYRQINDGEIFLIKSTNATAYIDKGIDTESVKGIPTFHYMDIPAVKNLRFYRRSAVQTLNYGDYAGNFMLFVIYQTAVDSVTQGIRDRLTYLINNLAADSGTVVIKFI